MSDKPDLTDTHGTLHPTDTYYFQEPKEHITKRIYIGPLGKHKLFQRTEIMQGILSDCNGLMVYGPSNFIRQVVMIQRDRHSGRGQARREWAPVLREQGEAAGSLGTRKQASPDEAPAGDLGTPQPPGLQETTLCCLSASLRDLQQ